MKKTHTLSAVALLLSVAGYPAFAASPVTSLPPAPVPAAPAASSPAAGQTPLVSAQTVPPDNPPRDAPATPPAEPNDMTAPLRDSAPDGSEVPLPDTTPEGYATEQVAPLNRQQIEDMASAYDQVKRGRAYQPVSVVPRISSQTVNLSPGASLPLLRTAVSQSSSVTFTDSTGAPWKQAAPPFNANEAGFYVAYIPDSNVITVQARRQYDSTSITVYLKGLPVPVVIDVNSGEPDVMDKAQIIDSRLDLRLPRRGPDAKPVVEGDNKIGLYDDELQAFLDGTPPADARRLTTHGNVPDTEVWRKGDDMFIRTRSEIRDSFERTLSSGDGTLLYRLPVTPYVTFSVMGKNVPLTISLE
ncbi:DotH/IcmK family type IV secretion protein [Salmonella enterica subsp. enterica serovar Typhimurium]|uniref:DotH/IcmK family type IV secretion protein n=1 Tax=Salmonella enterica TaxID=28901 RepID=UPI00402A2A91